MVIELCVVQFWSEIILVISNQTRAARSFDFEITRMISDQIALHSVQLPLYITRRIKKNKDKFVWFSVSSAQRSMLLSSWALLTMEEKIISVEEKIIWEGLK